MISALTVERALYHPLPMYYRLCLEPCCLFFFFFVTMSTDVPMGPPSLALIPGWVSFVPCTSLLGLVMVTLSALSEHKEGQILLAKDSMLNAIIFV